jgi:uncharacterized damage-inducible protein DinB
MGNTEINRLIREMKSIYSGSPWHGDCIKKILTNIAFETAFNRPVANAHSIAELLSHIIAWRELHNKRLHGNDLFSVKQQESFDWRKTDPIPEKAWPKLLHALDMNQQQMITALEQADDHLLDQKVVKRNYTFRKLIRGIIQHDIYHTGQIALLKKSQGL